MATVTVKCGLKLFSLLKDPLSSRKILNGTVLYEASIVRLAILVNVEISNALAEIEFLIRL